jgi:predicted nucleic-acid-binding Zn-ribbon protein
MAEQLATKLNGSKGEEVLVPCSKCTGKTAHEVVVSLDESGSDDEYNYHWNNHYQIIRCKGCSFTSFRNASSNSEDYVQIGHEEYEYATEEKLYPSRLEGRKDLGDGERFLPPDTRRVYKETLQALVNNSPVLAGIGLRALVETICKERNAAGGNLLAKIDNLAAQHVLTPASATILHKIRSLGNAAAHEVKPHSERQLGLAMDVVEHLLKDVYILPKLAEDEFDS